MSAGRKRTFDKDEALAKAMYLFWANGFAGTSLTDLTSTLGINKPSMYSAFGNKEKLFASALDHYLVNYRGPVMERFTNPTDAPLKQRLEAFLLAVIDVVAGAETPKGCFYTKSCYESDSAAIPEEVTSLLRDMESNNEATLLELLKAEVEKGELPESSDVQTLAKYLLTLMTGLSVQAKNGSSKEQLQDVVAVVVETFPGLES